MLHMIYNGLSDIPLVGSTVNSIPASGRLKGSVVTFDGSKENVVTLVLTKEQDGLMVMTSDSQRALVVVANSLGVGMIYDVVFESLCGAKLYVTPTLVSTYAIDAALPVKLDKLVLRNPTMSDAL
jgi:hypothetical protein